MNHTPLVSVGIITYNSSKYVLDALESVKAQTYKNIELIVSDDCSTDNTVEICQNWIEENRSRFVNSTLITVEKNTGTAANGNRTFAACKGDWVRLCAGDDALFPDSIEKFVCFVTDHPDAKFVVGNIKEYKFSFEKENVVEGHMSIYNDNNDIIDKPSEEQFRKMLYGNSFIPPAVFNNMEVVRELGGYDEKYRILEDFPFYLKAMKAGYKFYKIDEYVHKYRTSDTNVFGRMDVLFNYKHQYYDYMVRKDMCFPYYTIRERIRTHSRFVICWIMDKLGLRKNTLFNRFVKTNLYRIFALLTFDSEILRSFFLRRFGKL